MKKLTELPANLSSNHLLIIWIVYFCYSTVIAIVFQKLILPQIPSLHASNGLMNNDAIYFHQVAVNLAKSIKESGWGAWKAWPAIGATGNVSLLAVFYVLFGTQPAVIIPVNAALHASSGLLLLLLGVQIGGKRIGLVAGLIASSLFVIFPSSLNWYGQIHKDGYVIAGVLMIFYVWVRALNSDGGIKVWTYVIMGTIGGVVLIDFTRPYVLKILMLALFLIWLINLMIQSLNQAFRRKFMVSVILGASLAILMPGCILVKAQNENLYLKLSKDWTYKWREGNVLPEKIEKLFKTIAVIRAGMIRHNLAQDAGSLIDPDIQPDNIPSVIAYLPRALQIGLFAPFPSTWLKKLSLIRLVSMMEMVIWYCFVPGVILGLLRNSSRVKWFSLLLAFLFLAILGFVAPNIGTLYRIRYVYLFIVLLLGAVGWVDFFSVRFALDRAPASKNRISAANILTTRVVGTEDCSRTNRGKVLGSGGIVVFFTSLSFFGFFIRDVVMAHWFGMGAELDVFIIGMMIPMFLVSVISIPFGAAMTPFFIDLRLNDSPEAAQRFIHKLVLSGSLILFIVCLGLYLFSSLIMPVLGWSFSSLKAASSSRVMFGFLPILFFSGALIIGNSALNAMDKFLQTGLSQLVVPFCAILALYSLGHRFGVFSVVIGMVIGQVMNLLLVEYWLRKYGLSLLPRHLFKLDSLSELWGQYLPLAGAGFFIGAAIPINNAMAASLDEGSVSTLGMGVKLGIFVSGLVSTAITTVMIPYFSNFMAKKRHNEASRELSFFLVLATFVSVPLTLLMFIASPQIVGLVFHGGVMKSGDVAGIVRVFKYGILQLPFITCGMLFMRFATARKRSGIVLFATAIGLIVNVLLNLLLMQRMGPGGIALANSLSLAISSGLLLLLFLVKREVSWYSGVLLFMSWMLFLTLAFCIHFVSYVGIVVVLLAYGLQICGQWNALQDRHTFFYAN